VPPVILAVAAGMVLLLLGLCAATVYAMIRPATRLRVARWPMSRLLLLVGAAAIPWLVVWLAPIRIRVSIDGVIELIGWLCLALLAFAMLVLLPLTALVSVVIWAKARRR
jgi:uncharacterized paraquat-inducible protein A